MTQKLLEALKPCPFCGASLERFGIMAWCHPKNGCFYAHVLFKDEAIERWNTRHNQIFIDQDQALRAFDDWCNNPDFPEKARVQCRMAWKAAIAWTQEQSLSSFESQPSGWISVKDRLPPHMATVLAYINEIIIPGDGYFVDTVSYNEQRKSWQYALGNDDIDVAVTHWMPLPKAPENAG